MIEQSINEDRVQHLEDRVRYLEEVNRWILDSLDVMASLGDFQSSVQYSQEPAFILSACWPHLKRLMRFHAMAFYLVEEAEKDFVLTICHPSLCQKKMREEVSLQIEEGTFAWALHQNRVVLVPSRKFGHTVVFHVLATRSRILGMFVGILSEGECYVTEIARTLLSIFILNSAYVLETSGLYQKIHDHNRNLERLVQERTCQLQQARELAEGANIAKGQFLANVSHELRTPLNGIMGLTELVLESGLDADTRESMELVRVSAQSLLTIISDILDFSRIDSGKLILNPEDFSLRKEVGDIARNLAIQAHQKDLELVCQIAPEVPDLFHGDAIRLQQILNDLVGNAIKFTSRGELHLKVQSGARGEAEMDSVCRLQFCVRDTGIGIPLEKQKIIFEAFAQADGSSTRQFGGSGLGLTIAAHLVNLMGGEIWLVSEEGKGSEFYFEIPLQLQATPNSLELTAAPEEWRHATVLVVDDNLTCGRALEELLHAWGMDVQLVQSSGMAQEVLKEMNRQGNSFRLWFLDDQMPGTGGGSLLNILREFHPPSAPLGVVFLTTSRNIADKGRLRELGADEILSKPILFRELWSAVRRLLEPVTVLPPGDDRAESFVLGSTSSEMRRETGLRILLAEDNMLNQILASRLLERCGHMVKSVRSGKEAVAEFKAHSYDLLLLDAHMPEMDGFTAAAAIRGLERQRGNWEPSAQNGIISASFEHQIQEVPILAMTSSHDPTDQDKARVAGMNGCLLKPLKPQELFSAITHWTRKNGLGSSSLEESDIDFSAAIENAAGDGQLFLEMVQVFLADIPRMRSRLTEAVQTRDIELLEASVYGLKGAASSFFSRKANELMGKFELAVKRQEWNHLEQQLPSVMDTLSDLARQLKNFKEAKS
jgi:two-component system sensor histidine kinase/response regulator